MDKQWIIPMLDYTLSQAKWTKYFTIDETSILKLVKLQSLVLKCCKIWKTQLRYTNFANISNICTKAYYLQTKFIIFCIFSKGYIFHYLQHLATKLCKFSNFKMLFLAVVKDFVHLAWFSLS